jgi:hypothetical protein
VGAIFLRLKTDSDDPLANEARVLASAHVPWAVVPARENIVVERSAAPLEPRSHGSSGGFEQRKLHGALRLLLLYDGPVANPAARDDVADAYLDPSQPRNLLSMAKSDKARSRRRRCWSNAKRIAQTCCCLRARFAPM